jgi:hypothetical protein
MYKRGRELIFHDDSWYLAGVGVFFFVMVDLFVFKKTGHTNEGKITVIHQIDRVTGRAHKNNDKKELCSSPYSLA